MKLIFLRHGATDLNGLDAIRGWLDVRLNEDGQRQAAVAANGLSQVRLTRIYTSDLIRAIETANTVAIYHPGLTVEWTDGLRPINFGDLQGRPYAEVNKDVDALFEKWETDPSIKAPGGESFADFSGRFIPFMEKLESSCEEQDIVLLVSHTRVCSYAMARAMNAGKPLEADGLRTLHHAEVGLGNCAVLTAPLPLRLSQLNIIKQMGMF